MAKKQKRRPPAGRAKGTQAAARRQQAHRKKRRTGKRTLHYILLLFFVVAVGVTLSLTVFFKIGDIQVVGVDKYSPEEIIAATGIELEDNLLRVPTAEIEEALLLEFPYLETVKVQRKFPPKVEIQVTQCVPQGAMIQGTQVGLITLEGKLLEKGEILVPPELPLIKGLDMSGVEPGEMLGGEDRPENQERLWMLEYFFEAADRIGFGPITNVDVTDRLNIKMVYEARLVLELGSEADMEYKMIFLQEVIRDLGPEDQARLDATRAREKRVLVKWGKVEQGEFTPLDGSKDQIFTREEPEEENNTENPENHTE